MSTRAVTLAFTYVLDQLVRLCVVQRPSNVLQRDITFGLLALNRDQDGVPLAVHHIYAVGKSASRERGGEDGRDARLKALVSGKCATARTRGSPDSEAGVAARVG